MATILENESAWSTTPATNANVDTGVNWAENQDSASVNNSARGMMSARAKARLDQGGGLAAGGTANALTVTTNQVLSAAHLATGLYLVVRANNANTTAAVTFAPDGLTAQPIKRADGSALAIGSIQPAMVLQLYYNAGTSEWRCANIPPLAAASVSSAAVASFSAYKPGTQTVATTASTQVTFTVENFDVGGGNYYATSTWTPPAGTVFIAARVIITNNSGSTTQFFLAIAKDGASFAQTYSQAGTPLGSSQTLLVSTIDQTDGTHAYTVRISSSAQPYDIEAGSAGSVFFGYMI